MANALRSPVSRILAALLLTLSVGACSSAVKGPGATISKVKAYHLIPNERLVTKDRSVSFERQYYLHGAVTASEQMERAGNYYSILWKPVDRTQPVLLKFEYRQAQSGLEVREMELWVEDVRRSNWSKFQVTGPAYQADGRVTAWRVTLIQADQEIASQQSYLWE